VRRGLALWASLALGGCGSGWSEAFPAEDKGWLMSVWGRSATDVYAVGGTHPRATVMRLRGKDWSEVSLGLQAPRLNWVHGFGPEHLFAVGEQGWALHFDGSSWRRLDTGTEAPLWGVWGASPDDVWVVGGSGTGTGEAVILRWNGQAFTQVSVPALRRENVFAFFKVWGTGADDLRIVGQEGVILRWDGEALREEDSGVRDDLISLWGDGPDRVIAVGGRASAQVTEWDGTRWRPRDLPPLPGLNGVWFPPGQDPWVVGVQGTVLRLGPAGHSAEEVDTTLDLHAVFGTGGRMWSVGGNLVTGLGTQRGVALTRTYDAP
jgi:photosystem II stability/assembly factor-like uncharacterized protein